MKPMEKSMAVVSCTRPFQRVPNQLRTRMEAGRPSDEASREKTSGEYGFMPLANICWPQTQKPHRPTAHSARITARCAHTGLRENVERRCVVMPKQGSIAT